MHQTFFRAFDHRPENRLPREAAPPNRHFAPLVAPVIGGYIVKYFHWHMIFYVIGTMGFLAALLVFFIIPETHKQENRIPLRLNIIARNFMMLSKQKEVLGYMAAASFGFGGLFAFVTAGSIVYIGIYGIPVDEFGYFFMINIGHCPHA